MHQIENQMTTPRGPELHADVYAEGSSCRVHPLTIIRYFFTLLEL